MEINYQICKRCIMDTTDPDITFDTQGTCSHCKQFDALKTLYMHTGKIGSDKLDKLVDKIKKGRKNAQYDCIIGVSGGVDSTYVAWMVKKLGLRPLAVHLDNGWNSELAVSNIEKVLKLLDIDLLTHVLNWEEFKDLQLSFLKASVPDAEIPTDHAIVAMIFRLAAKMNIRYIISGSNYATEAVAVRAWSYGHSDWRYIRGIQNRFGTKALKDYPHYSFLHLIYYKLIRRQVSVKLLDYMDYNKESAMDVLQNRLGWKYYGGKHYESIYTRFFQGYILPVKFGFDKRRAHLSTLICSQQMSRDDALNEMEKAPYPDGMLQDDMEFAIKKLGLDPGKFDAIMKAPTKRYEDYPSYENHFLFKYLKRFYRWLTYRMPSIKKIGF